MIKLATIYRKIEMDKGVQVTEDACNVFLIATGQPKLNTARFLLTAEESQELDAFTRKIETRIGSLLTADYVPPAPAEEANALTEQASA